MAKNATNDKHVKMKCDRVEDAGDSAAEAGGTVLEWVGAKVVAEVRAWVADAAKNRAAVAETTSKVRANE